MAEAAKPIFRRKSLERLSTPDRLDQLLHVVKRRTWIPLVALGGLLALAVAWCFLGRVPITVDATAVLVYPQEVVPLQAEASGELLSLDVEVGDTVKAGQPVATLARTDLRNELALQQERLLQFQGSAQALSAFNRAQVEKEKALYDEQSERLETRIRAVVDMAESVRRKTREYNAEQRRNLEETRARSKELDDALRARFESYERLRAEALTSEDKVVDARQRWITNQLALADIEVRLQELELRVLRAEAVYESQMDLVADLRIQLEQVELAAHEADKRLEEARIHDETDEKEILRAIRRLEASLERESRIRADSDGTVLEVTVSPGSMVTAGQRIASMAKSDPDRRLFALAYFDNAAGKRIVKGDPALIAPVTVQPQRDGSIRGEVDEVSAYPVTADAVANQVGNREMARMLVGNESRIQVRVGLEVDPARPERFRWTSGEGPALAVTAGTTARVRVTLEERAPIALLIPVLRGWLGLD